MAKNKVKPQVINNIQELNLEIDYDKLAKAIVKAQEKSEKDSNEKSFTSKTFSTLTSFTFRIVAFLGGILALAAVLATIKLFRTFEWNGFINILQNIFCLIITIDIAIFSAIYSFALWKSAKEIEAENDKNYIISVFSSVVSFAALIVALIALYKGVR